MGIELHYIPDVLDCYRPVARCDVCQKLIDKCDPENDYQALYAHPSNPDPGPMPFWITHAGPCWRVLEQREGRLGSWRLDDFLIFLGRNVGADFAKKAKTAMEDVL